jgi:virginiamycin A acetyltransferase
VKRKWRLVRRVLIPVILVRLYYFWKHRAMVSGRSEVDIAASTSWGRGCVISAFTKIKISGRFVMGQRVQIASGCFIGAGRAGLTMGDDVLISPNCTIITGKYRFERLRVPLQQQGTEGVGVRIGHRVWVGANCAVLDGADIGDDVIVSAGSVVSGRIPPNTVVQGNPAKVIFTRRSDVEDFLDDVPAGVKPARVIENSRTTA